MADEDEGQANSRRGPEEMGHRPELLGSETIAKHVMDAQNQLEMSTYYLLDASGNTMAVYEREVDAINSSITFTQEEKYIYGSTRLGVKNDSIPLLGTQNDTYSQTTWVHTIGQRNYELSNHLGNVLSVISDKPIPHDNGSGTADYFLADIRQAQDYSPFGVTLQGRVFGGSDHRFGFQNQEFDPETGYVNYKYRMHDPRLGRFFAIDPLASKYSYNSPYSFSENCVIDCIELEGLEKIRHHVYSEEKKKWVVAWVETDKNLKENVNAYHKFNYKGQNYQTVVKPIYKTPGKAESVTYNGNIKPGSDNRENMYMQFKSTAEAKMSESEKNQAAAVNNSISEDATSYDSWEGGSDGANYGGQLAGQKGWDNGGKQLFFGTIGIVTLPLTLPAAGSSYFSYGVYSAGALNTIDDVGGVFISRRPDGTYQSLSQSFVKSENTKQYIAGVKSTISFVNAGKNIFDFSKATTNPLTLNQVASGTTIGTDVLQSKDNSIELIKTKTLISNGKVSGQ